MCECTQKSKKPLSLGKGFHYEFECVISEGNVKKIELDASNDNIAKQLAELECSEGIKTLSFEEVEKITSDKEKYLLGNVVELNPTTWTRVAQYSGGGCNIRLDGRWRPGTGHPFWDANGSSSETLNGYNKWCALIQIHAGLDVIATFSWASVMNGAVNIGYFGYPTAVIIFMNDDWNQYWDNVNEPGNPMRATVTMF